MIDILLACPIAFMAGFVDSIAGGGGLIQAPGLLFLFPNMPVVTVLATNKLSACCGTLVSSFHYVRALKIKLKSFLPTLLAAFIGAIIGAKVVVSIDNETLKPLVFILLIFIGIYTLIKKDFGLNSHLRFSGWKLQVFCILIGSALGFYDGFFGPGTGSILAFLFVVVLGFNFLEGSAFAKLVNLVSNIAALLFFIFYGHVLFKIGLPMTVFNMLGNSVGARLAIKKGSGFVRWIFLLVLAGIIIQFAHHLLSVN